MIRFELSPEEVVRIREVISKAAGKFIIGQNLEWLLELRLWARLLPDRLLRFAENFRLSESWGACLISGWSIDDVNIGPTPLHWRGQIQPSVVLHEEIYLQLIGSLLGDIYAWSTVQDGKLVQDLLPIPGQEREKSGNSSSSVLDLHTEDAFSCYRCDYLGLLCLRNDDAIPTSYASFSNVRLSPAHRRVLSEPRFSLLPDPEHYVRAAERGDSRSLPGEFEMSPLLFGGDALPYLAVDGFFIEPQQGDIEATQALAALLSELERCRCELVCKAGELLVIDNYLAVHGRRPFLARYDGRDRWLKRISVTRDLRKSRASRASPESRVLI